MALKDLLGSWLGEQGQPPASAEDERQLAAAVLLLEIARADFHVAEQEKQLILDLLSQRFSLDAGKAQALFGEAEKAHVDSVSLQPYIANFNRHSSRDERRDLLQALWQVAHVDQELDPHEEHMMRRIADLLYLSHADFIQAKLKVTGH